MNGQRPKYVCNVQNPITTMGILPHFQMGYAQLQNGPIRGFSVVNIEKSGHFLMASIACPKNESLFWLKLR